MVRILRTIAVLVLFSGGAIAQIVDAPSNPITGTVTTGGTFQVLFGASIGRKSIEFQNRSGNGDACYLFFGSGTATEGKSLLVPDQWYYLRSSGGVPNDEIQVTCATSSDAFWANVQ